MGYNNKDIQEVDMVGHSWFFKREWLPELWKITPDFNRFFRSGEDMGFSWALQQIGIKTYVPPHPPNDLDMYGSQPDSAFEYGTDEVRASLGTNFDDMFFWYINKGFKLLRST
jgi:hypothetical protein